ncbi:MAG: hypothetical protein R2749_32215 [Acidimicrobiales bacterium]
MALGRPAVAVGAHPDDGADNDHVLRRVVGVDEATWDALAADGQLQRPSFLDPDGRPY